MENNVFIKNGIQVLITDGVIPCGENINVVVPMFGLPYFTENDIKQTNDTYYEKHSSSKNLFVAEYKGFSLSVDMHDKEMCNTILMPSDYSLQIITPDKDIWLMRIA